MKRYRITVFDAPRTAWRSTVREAIEDAVVVGLASYDESRREHYLAVPAALQREDLPPDSQ